MNRDQIRYAFLVLAALAVGYLCFQMISPFLIAISWAAIMAIIVNPLYEWLRRRLKSANTAAVLSCIAALLSIIVPIIAITVAIIRAFVGFFNVSNAEGTATEHIVDGIQLEVNHVLEWVSLHLGIDNIDFEDFKSTAVNVGNFLVNQSQFLLGGVAGFLFNLVTVIFTLFFFLRDRDSILATLGDLMPLSSANASAVLRRVHDVIMASVIGGGAVSISQGLLATLGFWMLSIPNPILWGLATSFFSFIPFLGAAAIWVPTCVVLLIQGYYWKAIILAIWGTLLISLVDNILRPILIGDRTRLHTLLIFFSILGGLKVFGLLGLIMGPVVLAVGLALIDIFRREIEETEQSLRDRDPSGERSETDSQELSKAEV